jgi:hypothetical protein
MARCRTPIDDRTLVDYWARDVDDEGEVDRIEAHLFSCADCSGRLQYLAAIGPGLTTLARQGRLSAIVTRAVLNRLQRDGLRLRIYSLSPGETVPCAVFPNDDLVVTALRADFSGVDSVALSVAGADDTVIAQLDDVPVLASDDEVFWVTPAASLQALPAMKVQVTLSSVGDKPAELGRYILEHTAMTQRP